MSKTKDSNLKQTKEKLKQVSNYWSEINSLSKNAIYDINDTNVNWNKKINFKENEQVIKERIVGDLTPPQRRPTTISKPPKSLSITGLIFTIVFGLLFLEMFAQGVGLVMGPEGLIISTVLNAVGYLALTIGICLCKTYKNGEKTNETSPKKILKILGIILIVVGCLLVISQFVTFSSSSRVDNNYNSLLNILITLFGNFLFAGILCLGICLIFFKKINFSLKKKEYENKLKQVEENKKYNEEQLPKDLEKYEKKYKTLCDEQIKIINETHKQIAEIYDKIEKIDIVSKSQAQYADQLLDCFYKGAESIKEAFEMLEKNSGSLQQTLNGKSNLKWEDLSKEKQKIYIESAIKGLYTEQLNDEKKKNELSREQRALRRASLEDNEFLIEDLTEIEKEQVLINAKNLFEKDNNNNLDDEPADLNSEDPDLEEIRPLMAKYIKKLYKLQLYKPELREQYSAEEIEFKKEKLRNKDFKFEDLDAEEKVYILREIKDDLKYKDKYKKSTRRKLFITQIVLFSVSFLAIIPNFCLQFLTNMKSESPVIITLSTLTVVGIIVSMVIGGCKVTYCKRCGTKGVFVNSKSESKYEIERGAIPAYMKPEWVTDAHIAYDKNGKVHTEKLVQETTTTKYYECPCCKNQWTNTIIKKQ